MGHYDDCYAADYAAGRPVTEEDIKSLVKKVNMAGGVINCYDEDCTHAFWRKVASQSKELDYEPTAYKMFKIFLKETKKKKKK